MLAKNKTLIFCLLETGGGERGGEIKIVFKILKMSDFLVETWEQIEKKSLILEAWGQKGGGASEDCLEDKIWAIFILEASLRYVFVFLDLVFL